MFSSLLDSASERASRPPASVPAALALHALLFLAVLAATYASIGTPIDAPALRPITFVTILPPPVEESSGPTKAAAPKAPRSPEVHEPRSSSHEPIFEPIRVPDLLSTPLAPAADLSRGVDSGFPGGEANAAPGLGGGPGGPGDGPGSFTREGPTDSGSEVFVPGMPPQLLLKVEPRYPELMRMARLEGRVLLRAVIGEDGSVETVEVLRSSGPAFEAAALAAVKRWRYSQAMQNGRPVKVYVAISVDFKLE